MDAKRVIGAGVVAFLILFVAGYLVHAVWLAGTYRAMIAGGFSFRPQESMQRKLWIIWVSDFLYAMLFAWVYARGLEPKPWVGQGLRFGILMTLFTVVPATLNEYVAYNLPYTLAVRWMAAGLITLIVMGLAVAAIVKAPK
jgi:hypothetical protein